ncbi:hypothetical protein SLEP1_g2853 [Rubroshorea leprosula]|uniref:Uncharacterized protein n=1 Tax=Rubroshorea leprosula TaxID=152421 RepID=A0AAV5HT39_9ROSI|nr:hypothetical protein SLEP1_g2853 [Rubroshorea leprosula]
MEATDKMVCGPVDAINFMIATSFQIACIQIVSHFLLFLFKLLGQAGPIADVPNMKDITLEEMNKLFSLRLGFFFFGETKKNKNSR